MKKDKKIPNKPAAPRPKAPKDNKPAAPRPKAPKNATSKAVKKGFGC